MKANISLIISKHMTDKNINGNRLLSVDWLELWCDTPDVGIYDNQKEFDRWMLKKHDEGTRVFSRIYDVVWNHQIFASFVCRPYSPIIQANAVQIKFANWLLYSRDALEVITDLLKALHLNVLSCSRVDICADFARFSNGEDGQRFITRYVSGGLARVGNGKFQVNGLQSVKDKSKKVYQYIRFGSRSSSVCSYLYNKSAELEEVKMKPWIKDVWQSSFLADCDLSRDVWRLEFSITDNKFEFTDGEQVQLINWKMLFDKEYLLCLYDCLLIKYFDIREVSDTDTNITRWRKVSMFNDVVECFVRFIERANVGSNKMYKYLCRALVDTAERLRCEGNEDYGLYLFCAWQLITRGGVEEWAVDKLDGVTAKILRMNGAERALLINRLRFKYTLFGNCESYKF